MPAASQRRHVGHGAVVFAVGPPGNRTAAEVKIRVPRIAARPAADLGGERADLFGGGQAWVGEGGCLGGAAQGRTVPAPARRGGERAAQVWRCRLSGRGQRRRPARPGQPSPSRSQEAEHNADAAGDAAIAVLPAPDAPRADAEQLGDAVLCDAERAECRAEFGRGHCQVACFRVNGHNDVAADLPASGLMMRST